MPNLQRIPVRMNCEVGVFLTAPVDQIPQGGFPVLTNVRVVEEGVIEGRPGYTVFGIAPEPV